MAVFKQSQPVFSRYTGRKEEEQTKTPTFQPARTSQRLTIKQRDYVKNLGFTPSRVPTFRSETGGQGGSGSLLNKGIAQLGRFESGGANVLSNSIKNYKNVLNKFRSGNVLGGLGETVKNITLTDELVNFAKGFAGDTQMTGGDVAAQILEDPGLNTLKIKGRNLKHFADSGPTLFGKAKITPRTIADLGISFAVDPTTYVGAGQFIKGASKGTALGRFGTQLSTQALESPGIRNVAKLFNRNIGRDTEFVNRLDDLMTKRGFGKEISEGIFQLQRGELTEKGLKNLITDLSTKVEPTEFEKFSNILREGFDASKRLSNEGIDLTSEGFQKQAYRQLSNIPLQDTFEIASKPTKVKQALQTVLKQGDEVDNILGKVFETKKYSQDIEKLVQPARSIIDDILSPQIIEAGILPREIVERNKGQYLRSVYNKLGVAEEDQAQLSSRIIQNLKGSGLDKEAGALKREFRNSERFFQALESTPDILPPNVIQSADALYALKSNLDEVKTVAKSLINNDGSVNLVRKEAIANIIGDEATQRLINKGTNSIENVIADIANDEISKLVGNDTLKDVALKMKQTRGLVDDASLIAAETINQTNTLIQKYSFLDWTSKQPFATDQFVQGSKRIPNEAKFGNLAGKYLPEAMAEDIVGILSPPKTFLSRLTNTWKKVKLFGFMNSATNARNAVSNMVLNSMVEGGLKPHRMDMYLKAALEVEKGGKWYQEFRKAGGFLSSLTDSEVSRELYKQGGKLDRSFLDKMIDVVDKGANAWTGLNNIPGIRRLAGEQAFKYTEQTGKLAQYIFQRQKGKSIEEALKITEQALFNYNKIPQALNAATIAGQPIRDVIPFLSFRYFSSQLALDTLLNRTGKITGFFKTMREIENLTRGSEEELPDYMNSNRFLQLRTPWLDKEGNPKYLDMTYLFPFGDITGGFAPEDIALGNPFVRQGVEQSLNRNIFFDSPIVRPGQSGQQQLQARLQNLVGGLGPSGLAPVLPLASGNVGTTQSTKLLDAIQGRPDYRGRIQDLPSTALDTIGGLKFRRINPDEQRVLNIKSEQNRINDVEAEINRIKKSKQFNRDQKRKLIDDLLNEKQRLLQQNR